MKKYDAIVIGSGSGATIVDEAAAHGLKTALIDKGPLIGGTCLNWGCIPSKQLITVADRIAEIQEGRKLGVTSNIDNIDFKAVMERMRSSRSNSQRDIRGNISQAKTVDFYEGEARFVADYDLEVNGQRLEGKKIFIAAGSRPLVPPIKGLEDVDYLDNESVLELKECPDSLIIIGGGYIAVEYGHFFAAMGTKVTMLEMADRLVLSEEPEIARLLEKKLSGRMTVHTGAPANEIKVGKNGVTVVTTDRESGRQKEYTAQKMMVAVGRRSNADTLEVGKAGVEVDQRGYIKVNDFMETSRKNIFAFGDIIGRQMFTHMATRAAAIVADNVLHDSGIKVDFTVVPHAVYSYPQIASVGLKEEEARRDHDVTVGVAMYSDIAKGEALMDADSFAKAVMDKKTGGLLGFHIIGPEAPNLIQEVVNAMGSGGGTGEIFDGIHIHPALSELIPVTLNKTMDGD
jgi:mycothione reductase